MGRDYAELRGKLVFGSAGSDGNDFGVIELTVERVHAYAVCWDNKQEYIILYAVSRERIVGKIIFESAEFFVFVQTM